MDPLILLIEPELDQRAAAATMSRAQKVYEEGARDISRVMRTQITEGTTAAGRGFEEMETKARRAYLGMQDAGEKVAAAERKLEAARERGASNTEALARRVERARLDEIQAIERATTAYRDYENAAQNAGQAGENAGQSILGGLRDAVSGAGQSGGDMANEFVGGFAGSSALLRLGAAAGPIGLALAGVAALGVTAGKVLADNINAGLQSLRTQDLFQTRLGVDDATMAQYGSAAAKAYTDNWGASVEDNLRAVQFGVQGGVIAPGASDTEIQNTIAQMQTLASVMEVDVQEAARAAGQLMRGGFAADGEQAADIIVTGFQSGLDIAGDWLDTITEYSTQFRKLGLDGPDAIGLISQGLQGAARDSDVVADSLKEFSIRSIDGSKSTAEGFAAIGFKADEMAQKFLAGGDSARAAFGATLEAIKALDDPQQQALAWADLFGTQWEDMGDAINKMDLSKARTEFGSTEGAIDKMTDKLSSHTNGWDSLGRQIDTTFGKLQTWLADTTIGKFFDQGLPAALGEKFDALANQFNGPKLGPNGEYTGVPSTSGRPLFPQGPGITSLAPPTAPSGNPLDIITGGVPSGGLTPPNFYKDWYKPSGTLPDGAPIPGAPTPILTETQQAAKDEAEKAAKGGKSLPDAPVLPLQYSSTAGLPSGIANATTRLDEARHEVAEKEARLGQLMQSNLADESDRQKARNDLTKAEQDRLKAEQALTDARISATRQGTKQLGQLSSDMDDFGNKLDADFGISKGLGGIVENFVKAAGNILAAPFLQALGMVEKANPNEGSGIVGMLAANGAFGSKYTPAAIAALQAQQGGGAAGSYTYGAPVGGASFAANPGESARDFAHRAMMPYWESQGFKVGDHQADQYGEHQNGALDIMVPSIAEGQKVLQQVLADPNVYGAIFNNQTYGYGHGATPQDYSAGHTGDPTQDHQDHVHAFYKPGGTNNLTPQGQLTSGASSGPVPVSVVSAPGMPSQGLSEQQWNAIAGREASGNWAMNSGNGYSGGLQFSPSTWTGFGGGQYAPEAWQATPQQQMDIGNRVFASQGPGAWPTTSAEHPEWFQPGQAIPGVIPGSAGGQGYPGVGYAGPAVSPASFGSPFAGQAGPGVAPGVRLPGVGSAVGAAGPGIALGSAYPAVGGNSGDVLGGAPMAAIMGATDALGAAGDVFAPGSGAAVSAAAKIGIQLANRTVGFGAQVGGIAGSGLMETLSLGDNPRGGLGSSWLGKLAGGLAGAAPALPNLAGGKKPPGPMEQAGGGPGQNGNVDNSQTNHITVTPPKDTSANTQAAMVGEQTRMYSQPGKQ